MTRTDEQYLDALPLDDPLPEFGSDPEELAARLAGALEGRRLLEHPFYRRWQDGDLAPQELAEYGVHYRAFEACLPEVLEATVRRLESDGELEVAEMVRRNLDDERGRPAPHLELFDRFADALPTGPQATAPGAAAEALVATYWDLVAEGPAAALAGLAAYETQAAAIARTKSEGLRAWYGLDEAGTTFWDVHAKMDEDHGAWALEALFTLGAEVDDVDTAAVRAADAWWALLDERETEAPALAGR